MEATRYTEGSQKIGYVVVVNRGEEGYVGGYLCVNERGAPIEFWHTTESPIKINRLQALLYGKTLMPELIGRHITGTLLSDEHGKPRIKPSLLLTKEEAILRGFDNPNIPVVLIEPVGSSTAVKDESTCQRITTGAGEVVIRWKQESTADVNQLIPSLKSVDVLEPFERISMLLDDLSGKGPEKSKE
jgi:hypothetical protein